jgi:hypothetical protein
VEYVFPSIIIVVIGLASLTWLFRSHKYDKVNVVNPGVEYPTMAGTQNCSVSGHFSDGHIKRRDI